MQTMWLALFHLSVIRIPSVERKARPRPTGGLPDPPGRGRALFYYFCSSILLVSALTLSFNADTSCRLVCCIACC